MGIHISDGDEEIHIGGGRGGPPGPRNWVDAYLATLRFIRGLAGLACFAWVAWLVVPRLGGFCHWVSGLDRGVLTTAIVAPLGAMVLVAGLAIYAVFFRGTRFVERIVNSETAREAVRRKRGVTIDVEATPVPPPDKEAAS